MFSRVHRRCRTRKLPLHGADSWERERDAARTVVGNTVAEHLAARYGNEVRVLVAMVENDRTLLDPLVPGLPYIGAEAVFAARHEMVATLDDVFTRRTRARLLALDATADAARRVAALIAPQSILLGMTFPLMSGALLRRYPDTQGRGIAALYFSNSMGAAVGVLASGFVFLPAAGLPGTVLVAGGINVVLAGFVFLLAKTRGWQAASTPPAAPVTSTSPPALSISVEL